MDHKYLHLSKPTLHPICFKAKARFVAKVDFPTPPFALETAIVNFVPKIGIFYEFPRFQLSFSLRHLVLAFYLSYFYHYLFFTNKDTIYFGICQMILKEEVEVHGVQPPGGGNGSGKRTNTTRHRCYY